MGKNKKNKNRFYRQKTEEIIICESDNSRQNIISNILKNEKLTKFIDKDNEFVKKYIMCSMEIIYSDNLYTSIETYIQKCLSEHMIIDNILAKFNITLDDKYYDDIIKIILNRFDKYTETLENIIIQTQNLNIDIDDITKNILCLNSFINNKFDFNTNNFIKVTDYKVTKINSIIDTFDELSMTIYRFIYDDYYDNIDINSTIFITKICNLLDKDINMNKEEHILSLLNDICNDKYDIYKDSNVSFITFTTPCCNKMMNLNWIYPHLYNKYICNFCSKRFLVKSDVNKINEFIDSQLFSINSESHKKRIIDHIIADLNIIKKTPGSIDIFNRLISYIKSIERYDISANISKREKIDKLNMISDSDKSNMISDNDKSNMISDSDKLNMISDNDKSNIISDSDKSNMISDNDKSNMISDSDKSNMILDSNKSNIVSYSDKSNMIFNSDKSNMISDNAKSNILSDNNKINYDESEILDDDLIDTDDYSIDKSINMTSSEEIVMTTDKIYKLVKLKNSNIYHFINNKNDSYCGTIKNWTHDILHITNIDCYRKCSKCEKHNNPNFFK
jgi:hypothetical protein